MTPNLDIDQLKTFLAIADTGSFTRAAEETNKTQSAVSMQMKKLEETLGRNLFQRDGRGSRMSPDGERFVGHARNLVTMNDEIARSYLQPSITGTVRFGTPDDYADLFLPEVLAKFARSHPMVTVDVECVGSAHLYERIKRGEMDVALVTFFDNDSEGEILRREELRWVTSSRHGTHNLPNLPLATADSGCQWRKLASDSLIAQGRSFRIAYSSPNRAMLDAYVDTIRALRHGHRRIYVVLPVPEQGWDVPKYLGRIAMRGDRQVDVPASLLSVYRSRHSDLMQAFNSLADDPSIVFVDSAIAFCDLPNRSGCVSSISGEALYYDDNHLTNKGAAMLLREILKQTALHETQRESR